MIIRHLISILIYFICSNVLANPIAVNPTPEQYWQTFRHQNPLFIQDVVLSSPLGDGSRLLLLTEPPPLLYGVVEETLLAVFGKAYQGHEIFTQRIGFDGWVKDVVVRLDYAVQSERSLRRDIAVLHQELFGTDYKANYRLFDVKPWSDSVTLPRQDGAPPDMQVSCYSMQQWFFGDSPVQFYERTASTVGFKVHSYTPVTLEQAFKAGRSGVFYAVDAGVVVILVDRARQLNRFKPLLRQFFLDTDVLFGAISPSDGQSKMLALVGRERDTSLAAMAPLRVETVFTLAASEEKNLTQSFELLLPLADETTDSELMKFVGVEKDVDWGPIFLSHDLTHTEYGNLLNVTDQIIKVWSESNEPQYGNFPYRAPWKYPYSKGVFNHLQNHFEIHSLIYNWNTTGFGAWVRFKNFNVFALYRTGALPISYIPDDLKINDSPEAKAVLTEAEDKYWKFFAELRDPNLNRAAQYAALHIIFQKYAVNADREEYKIPKSQYDKRWETMELETFQALKAALKHLDKPLREFISEFQTNQCMPLFKLEDLIKWEEKKQLIASEIKNFSSQGLLRDLSRYLTNRQYFYSENARWNKTRCNSLTEQRVKLLRKAKKYESERHYCNGIAKNNPALYVASDCHLVNSRIGNLEKKIKKFFSNIRFCERALNKFENLKELANIAVEVFGDCSKAWQGIVAEQKDFSSGFIKTPSIVVSSYPNYYGGHNIDDNAIEFVLDSTISPGNFDYEVDTNVIKISPSDAIKANDIGRNFERNSLDDKKKFKIQSPKKNVAPLPPPSIDKSTSSLNKPAPGKSRDIISLHQSKLKSYIADVEKFNQIKNDLEANIVIEKSDLNYQMAYMGNKNLIVWQSTHPELWDAIEDLLGQAIHDYASGSGESDIVIVVDRNLSLRDMEIINLATITQQILLSKSTGNQSSIRMVKAELSNSSLKNIPIENRAMDSENEESIEVIETSLISCGSRTFIAESTSSNGKNLLTRTDVDWNAVILQSTRIISKHNNQGAIVAKLKIPFKKDKATDSLKEAFIRITSFFKRNTIENDTNILKESISDSLSVDIPNESITRLICSIRREYKERVDDEVNLHFDLQQGQDIRIKVKFKLIPNLTNLQIPHPN